MKIALIVLAVLAGLVLLMLLVGALLPRAHSATSTATYAAAPEQVWKAITDWREIPRWRPEVTAVEEFEDKQGRKGWIERSRFGRLPLVVERSEPPRLFIGRIADPDLPFGGTWTYRLEPHGQGTRLSITEDGEVRNAFFRFMARFVFGHHRTMDGYLVSLGRRFGETVRPTRS